MCSVSYRISYRKCGEMFKGGNWLGGLMYFNFISDLGSGAGKERTRRSFLG